MTGERQYNKKNEQGFTDISAINELFTLSVQCKAEPTVHLYVLPSVTLLKVITVLYPTIITPIIVSTVTLVFPFAKKTFIFIFKISLSAHIRDRFVGFLHQSLGFSSLQ